MARASCGSAGVPSLEPGSPPRLPRSFSPMWGRGCSDGGGPACSCWALHCAVGREGRGVSAPLSWKTVCPLRRSPSPRPRSPRGLFVFQCKWSRKGFVRTRWCVADW